MKLKLLNWYKLNKKDLPWRINQNPYEVWISEIILQQTKIEQGTSYYLNFLKKFATLTDLAKATEEEILKQWEGLGYYSRARNLHFTAKKIYFELNNVFPNSYATLLNLKGIGKYTAAAIASICFKQAVSAIDGNAFRVYSRLFTIDLDISKSKNFNYFFELGNKLIDQDNPGDFNQAVMDLGSTICLPKNAKCTECPLLDMCASYKNNSVYSFPVKSKKIKITKEEIYYLKIFDHKKNFILRQREGSSIWANMFDFPEIEMFEKETKNKFTENLVFLNTINHVLTHKKLKIYFYEIELASSELLNLVEKNSKYVIADLSKLKKYPLPKPMENFFLNLVVV